MIPEFSVVKTTHKIGRGPSSIPEGTKGTVVYQHKDGINVEVEFFGKHVGVLTLNSERDISQEKEEDNRKYLMR